MLLTGCGCFMDVKWCFRSLQATRVKGSGDVKDVVFLEFILKLKIIQLLSRNWMMGKNVMYRKDEVDRFEFRKTHLKYKGKNRTSTILLKRTIHRHDRVSIQK